MDFPEPPAGGDATRLRLLRFCWTVPQITCRSQKTVTWRPWKDGIGSNDWCWRCPQLRSPYWNLTKWKNDEWYYATNTTLVSGMWTQGIAMGDPCPWMPWNLQHTWVLEGIMKKGIAIWGWFLKLKKSTVPSASHNCVGSYLQKVLKLLELTSQLNSS